MAQPIVQARPRSVLGKKVKTLRRKGILPANVYGHNKQSQALELDAHQFLVAAATSWDRMPWSTS